jgi:GrpB-like predicted nucleotidyltransferase (UPF0157 family)
MSFEYKKYSTGYNDRFEEMKKNILDLSSKKLAIEHIGSTSVKGLGGKGIIDISIGIRKWDETKEILKILKKLGFKHFHDVENYNIFVSTKACCEENDFHVHISRIGTKRYERTLAFRDYLRKNPKITAEYVEMKKESFRKARGNRNVYKNLKHEWFSSIRDLI